MSSNTTTLNHERMSGYYVLEDVETVQVSTSRAAAVEGLRERWHTTDAVLALIDELTHTGRGREAAAIRRVLGHEDDEEAMRAYVSRLWADDWDSPRTASTASGDARGPRDGLVPLQLLGGGVLQAPSSLSVARLGAKSGITQSW